jgi:hypothetical protein
VAAQEAVLADCLRQCDWPREMWIAYQLDEGGGRLALDVAVPEIAHFPYTVLSMSRHGVGVAVNWLPDATRRRLYRDHLQALGVRLVGEAFAALPGMGDVIFFRAYPGGRWRHRPAPSGLSLQCSGSASTLVGPGERQPR